MFILSLLVVAVVARRWVPVYRRWDIASVGLGMFFVGVAIAGVAESPDSLWVKVLAVIGAGALPFAGFTIALSIGWLAVRILDWCASAITKTGRPPTEIENINLARRSVRTSYRKWIGPI